MQLDPDAAAIIGVVSSVIAAIVSTACSTAYTVGRLNEKTRSLEKDLDIAKATNVSFKHFESVVAPLQGSINSVQSDITKILIILGDTRK